MAEPPDRPSPPGLGWIEDTEHVNLRPSDEYELIGNRTFSNTVLKKSKENILVPMGLVATTACLTLGLLSMRRGNSTKQQFYMRGRVGFQAFTIAAMTLGVLFTSNSKNKNRST